MESEYFKTWLGVGVVSGLVLNLVDTNLRIEFLHDSQEVTETDISICDETLDLMELRQVSGVESLVAEDTINREIFHWFEAILTLALLR